MATFPSLIPSSRTFTPESYAGAAAASLKGTSSRVAHSTAAFGAQLRLSFIGLNEAERFAIEAHYHGQRGGLLAFALPAETFSGTGGGGAPVLIEGITYSQRSTYVDNDPADFEGMTNGIYAEATQTGTNNSTDANNPEYVQMDLGEVMTISRVVVGTDFDEVLAGGWDKTYTEDRDVYGSTDGDNWDLLFNTGTFDQGIQEYDVNATVRYVRIESRGYMCVTEFYAMAPGAGGGGGALDPGLWRYSAAPEIEDFCGPHYDVTVTLESVTS